MHPVDEMKAYVGLTERDRELLERLATVVEPHIEGVIDAFYERALSFPTTRDIMGASPVRLERLRKTLRQWLLELLSGPWDEAYYERRQRIGRTHVRVGLPERYVFTAMCVVREALCGIAERELDLAETRHTCRAVGRIAALDLAIITSAYVLDRERMQINSLQELFVQHLPVSVLLVDADGRVVASTAPASSVFRATSAPTSLYLELLPAELVRTGRLEEAVRGAVASGLPRNLPRVDASIDGVPRSFRVGVVPLDHPHAQFLLHVEELTEAVETEARMRRSEALAQLGSLSAAVAHELRNPLAGISGAIQVISGGLEPADPRRPILGKVQEQIERLNALVTDLLMFARPGITQLGPTDLRAVADSVVDLVRREVPRVQFVLEGEGRARADRNLVHQVLLNLVQNACQALSGSGRVLVKVEGSTVLVCDDGKGVESRVRPRVFEPFFTTRARGTGLGLAISERAAHSMRGDLKLLAKGPLSGAAFLLALQPLEGSAATGRTSPSGTGAGTA